MIFDLSPKKVESSFNIGLLVNTDHHEIVISYLYKILGIFCDDMHIDESSLTELPFDCIFTDVEFNKINPDENEESFINKSFYPKVCNDIKKQESGKIDFHTKYCFTIDETLTPNKSISGIYYGTLQLGNKPVLFYLRVDVQKIINVLKLS